MANDKQKLQEKADALRRDLSELDAQIAKMPSQPESVKPVITTYEGGRSQPHYLSCVSITLSFDTPEQAEKAKAILEKMEFGDCPIRDYEEIELLAEEGWRDRHRVGTCIVRATRSPYQEAAWRMGALRKA